MTAHVKLMWERLVDHVDGIGDSDIEVHISSCAECSKAVIQLEKIKKASSTSTYQAPKELLTRAYEIMAGSSRRLPMLRTTLATLGARSALAEDFQVVYGDTNLSIRVMYSPNGENWDVMASLPDESYTAYRLGEEVEKTPDMGLLFTVRSLGDAGFTVRAGDMVLDIPSPQEVLSDGP